MESKLNELDLALSGLLQDKNDLIATLDKLVIARDKMVDSNHPSRHSAIYEANNQIVNMNDQIKKMDESIRMNRANSTRTKQQLFLTNINYQVPKEFDDNIGQYLLWMQHGESIKEPSKVQMPGLLDLGVVAIEDKKNWINDFNDYEKRQKQNPQGGSKSRRRHRRRRNPKPAYKTRRGRKSKPRSNLNKK
jgi:hypothetical protein